MTNSVSEQHEKLVVTLQGDVDLEHSPAIRSLLLDCMQRGKDVIVDLTAVTYIDSSGIANLVEAMQGATRQGTRFGLVAVAGQVTRVLELARLDKVFDVHGDLAGALAAAG